MLFVKLCILLLLANDTFGSKFWDGDQGISYEKYLTHMLYLGKSTTLDTHRKTTTPEKSPTLEQTTTTEPTTTTEQTPTTESTTTSNLTITEKSTTTTGKPTTEALCAIDANAQPVNCNSSLFYKKDLQILIDDIVNDSEILTNITNDFHKNAVDMLNKYLQKIEKIYQRMQSRPEHLRDILEGTNNTRKELDPLVEKISGFIDRYRINVKDYQEKNNTASQLLQKFGKYNQICDLNCEKHITYHEISHTQQISTTRQSYDPKEYYCGSFAQLKVEAVTSLKKFAQSLQKDLDNKIRNDSDSYRQKVVNVQHELVNYTLEKFGQTMYDVLNLEDLYIHLSENISKANFESNFKKIRQNVAELSSKVISFEDAVNKFGRFCRTCNNDNNMISRSVDHIFMEETETYNLLKEIIDAKEKEITKSIYDGYTSLLKPLDDELNQPFKTGFIEKLNKTQEIITIETNKQIAEFNQLKSKFDKIPSSEAEKIQQESAELSKKLEKYIQLIDEFIKKN